VSIAGNVADTYRISGQAGRNTDALDVIIAAFWPAAVLLAIEMFVSRLWPKSFPAQTVRWTATLGLGFVAAFMSWIHLSDLLASRGQPGTVASLGPLAIDGLAIMATALILANRGHKLDEAPAVDEAATDLDAYVAEVATDIGRLQAEVQDLRTGPVATEADVAESEAAFRGEGLSSVADEAQSYLARLNGQLDSATTPAHPLDARPAAVRAEVKAESVPGYAGNLIKAWAMADPDQRPRPGQVDQAVALACEVSPRQARRWRYALLGS
jgi:hypothetical protein